MLWYSRVLALLRLSRQACLVRERRAREREVHLLQGTHAAAVRQALSTQHREMAEAMKTAQEETANAKRQLQHQQAEAQQLAQKVLQLQEETAEQLHTADQLVKALAICGPPEAAKPGGDTGKGDSRQLNHSEVRLCAMQVKWLLRVASRCL